MKFLICGIGSIGQRHYRNLKELGHDLAVFRGRGVNTAFIESFLKEQADAGSPVCSFSNLEEALNTFKPDALFATNPTSAHLDVVLPAARSGIHLFIEKPISHSMERIEELEKLAEEKKLKVMIGYNLRFHPLLRKMKSLFDEGKIGKPLAAHVEVGECVADFHPWEDYRESYIIYEKGGGGAVLSFSHDIDYLYWFLGAPKKIHAIGGKMTPLAGDADDMTKTIMEFPNGAIASLHIDYWQRPYRRLFELIGTEGKLVWDYMGETLSFYPRMQEQTASVWGVPDGFERNQMFLDEASYFIDLIAGKVEPFSGLEDGMAVLKLANEIRSQIKPYKK